MKPGVVLAGGGTGAHKVKIYPSLIHHIRAVSTITAAILNAMRESFPDRGSEACARLQRRCENFRKEPPLFEKSATDFPGGP